MKPVPTRGIHVQTAMAWLLGRLVQKVSPDLSVPFGYEGAGPHHFGGGSVNMKLGYSVVGYVGAAEDGRQRLLNYYAAEALEGHGGGEILTPSHRQLHVGFHAAAALHALRTGDVELAELPIGWLRVEHALLSACLTEIREKKGRSRWEPWTAGARAVQKGKLRGDNKGSGAFLRSVATGEPPEKIDQYFLGAACAAALPDEVRRRISRPPLTWPTIAGGLTIQRWPDGSFCCLFESLPTKGGGARAAGRVAGEAEPWIERGGMPAARLTQYQGLGEPPLTIRAPLPMGRPEKPSKRGTRHVPS